MIQVINKVGVIIRHNGRVLLIREKNRKTLESKWNIIKGTFEPNKDSTLFDTAIRESREEANASIKLKHFLGIYYLLDKKKSLTMFTFIADLKNKNPRALSQKTQKKYGNDIIEYIKFFTHKELKELKPNDFIGTRGYLTIQDYLDGEKYNLDIIKNLPKK